MTITIIDRAGDELITLDRSSRTFARHLERGDIVRTTEPLVFKLIREAALVKLTPAQKRNQYLASLRS